VDEWNEFLNPPICNSLLVGEMAEEVWGLFRWDGRGCPFDHAALSLLVPVGANVGIGRRSEQKGKWLKGPQG